VLEKTTSMVEIYRPFQGQTILIPVFIIWRTFKGQNLNRFFPIWKLWMNFSFIRWMKTAMTNYFGEDETEYPHAQGYENFVNNYLIFS
jgi:hypothetical protein